MHDLVKDIEDLEKLLHDVVEIETTNDDSFDQKIEVMKQVSRIIVFKQKQVRAFENSQDHLDELINQINGGLR